MSLSLADGDKASDNFDIAFILNYILTIKEQI